MALEHVGEAEKEKQQGTLKRRPDECRTQCGQYHQDIDIQHTLAQRGKGGADSLLSRKEVGTEIKRLRRRADSSGLFDHERSDEKE